MIKYKDGDSWKDAVLDYYPVGALYFSFSNTSPSTLFGGQWSLLSSAGRMIGVYGKNSNGDTVPAGSFGGDVNITVDRIPVHSHRFFFQDNTGSLSGQGFYSTHFESNNDYYFYGYNNRFAKVGYLDERIFVNSAGGAVTQKGYFPAYYGTYIWERVA